MFSLLDLSGLHKINCNQMIKFEVLIFLSLSISIWSHERSVTYGDQWFSESWCSNACTAGTSTLSTQVFLCWGNGGWRLFPSHQSLWNRVVCKALLHRHNEYTQRDFIRKEGKKTLKIIPAALWYKYSAIVTENYSIKNMELVYSIYQLIWYIPYTIKWKAPLLRFPDTALWHCITNSSHQDKPFWSL